MPTDRELIENASLSELLDAIDYALSSVDDSDIDDEELDSILFIDLY